jgi:hypothetical protein
MTPEEEEKQIEEETDAQMELILKDLSSDDL